MTKIPIVKICTQTFEVVSKTTLFFVSKTNRNLDFKENLQ